MPAMLGPILGPVVGGTILQNLHWSWIFLVNVPIGVVAFVARLADAAAHRIRRGRAAGRGRPGAALDGLDGGRVRPRPARLQRQPDGPAVVVPIVAGARARRVVFCWHALRVERPLLDMRLYANRVFAAASLTTFGLGAALFGAMILVPLYYQEVRHESLIVTGLLVGPQGLGMLLVMPIAGRLTDRFGGGRVALVRRLGAVASARSRWRSSARTPRSPRSRSCCCCAAWASASRSCRR